jgi:hypothetical protein
MPGELPRTPQGGLEVLISEDPDWVQFEQFVHRISRETSAQCTERIDGIDARYWDFRIDGKIVTLHLQHYLGISVFGANPEADEAVQKVANLLKKNPEGGT